MAWLSGWDKRIEISIGDYANDIGAEVVWFPVTVFLTATQCEEVFVELTTDAEYLKVAFTKADGTTELYSECELYDQSEELGVFHVSRDGWTINANTSIFLYYDKDHADNTTYIGAINTAAGAAVWDGNFEAVFHMVDATTSTVVDSTSNNIDLTKAGANNPLQTTSGKVGYAQHFSSDYMTHATFLDVMPDDLTVEACMRLDVIDINHYIFFKYNVVGNDNIALSINADEQVQLWARASGVEKTLTSTNTVNAETWYYVVGVQTADAVMKVYLDTAVDSGDILGSIADGTQTDIVIGAYNVTPDFGVDGIMDELRFSSTPRAATWLKGTYNSLWDTLFTYGSEEKYGNVIFFGSNF